MSDNDAVRNLFTFLPESPPRDATGASPADAPKTDADRTRDEPQDGHAWHVLAAHVVELGTAGVLDAAGMAHIARALDAAQHARRGDTSTIRNAMAKLEARVDSAMPGDLAGAATIGLAREEWIATIARLTWRDAIQDLIAALIDARLTVLDLADAHSVTIMPAFIDSRPAQPTTLAHFLGGVIAPLASSCRALVDAWRELDRSPLGAGLLAGEVVDADRAALAYLLGFEGPIPNTLDALSSVEDFAGVLGAAIQPLAIGRRFVRELLEWMRADPTSFLVDDEWSSHPEPGQPLMLVPSRLRELELGLGVGIRRLQGSIDLLRDMPYGPLGVAWERVATEIPRELQSAAALIREFGSFIGTGLIVNRAYLGNRAGRGYTTSGDLATFLMTQEQVAPAAARQIAGLVLARVEGMGVEVSGITPDMIDSAALLTIGQELKVELEALGRFMAPRRFIERREVSGSPAPAMTRAWLAEERSATNREGEWLRERRAHLETRFAALHATITQASSDDD